MTRVLTIGTFDLLHYGHMAFLARCAALGDLTVGVNSDEFTAAFKRTPVLSQDERILGIQGLGYEAVLNNSAGRELIGKTAPDIVAIGSDWAVRDYRAQIGVTQDWLDEQRIGVAYIPYTGGISTSEIIARIRPA